MRLTSPKPHPRLRLVVPLRFFRCGPALWARAQRRSTAGAASQLSSVANASENFATRSTASASTLRESASVASTATLNVYVYTYTYIRRIQGERFCPDHGPAMGMYFLGFWYSIMMISGHKPPLLSNFLQFSDVHVLRIRIYVYIRGIFGKISKNLGRALSNFAENSRNFQKIRKNFAKIRENSEKISEFSSQTFVKLHKKSVFQLQKFWYFAIRKNS